MPTYPAKLIALFLEGLIYILTLCMYASCKRNGMTEPYLLTNAIGKRLFLYKYIFKEDQGQGIYFGKLKI